MLLYNKGPEPFEEYKVYLNYNYHKRRHLITLIKLNDPDELTSMNYSKFLMCIHEKRWIEINYDVDHINGNQNDNRIENLQILTHGEHATKTGLNRSKHGTLARYKKYKCRCILCREAASKYQKNLYKKRLKGEA